MSGTQKVAKENEPQGSPGAGYQAGARRSAAFRDTQVLEGIRQVATEGQREPNAQASGRFDERSPGQIPSPHHGQSPSNIPAETNRMDAQWQLNQYRERLANEMERRERNTREPSQQASQPLRISPIAEESMSPQLSSEPTTTSTESGNTIRGGMTPGLTARTPSYPFPRMQPSFAHPSLVRPFPPHSPNFDGRLYTGVISDPSTPGSAMTFLPTGFSQPGVEHDYPTPNLYDLSLMLSAEPGLDAWWSTVVQIMTEVYRAERVTLAVPADPTDIENVPWGQKATYNCHPEDQLSLGYMARGLSFMNSSAGDSSEAFSRSEEFLKPRTPLRPPLLNRHSFTSYEERKERSTLEHPPPSQIRPGGPARSKSSYPAPPAKAASPTPQDDSGSGLNKQALEEHDALEERQNIPSWEDPYPHSEPVQGKVLNVLQALDYEADPLLDHNGVGRVLERGRVIALTRNYPYLDEETPVEPKPDPPKKGIEASKRNRRARSESTSKLSTILGGAQAASNRKAKGTGDDLRTIAAQLEDEDHLPPSPRYEEFEQAPPSPWSQSPAPSPAVRSDPNENPFFTDAVVDEESFNPTASPQNYTNMKPPEAIGVDNSWTVLHIPLSHVLLSKPHLGFKLDASTMERKSFTRSGDSDSKGKAPFPEPAPVPKEKHAPIAILSILSPIIPYPSNLRHSLEHLAPHLATSFSLCRHYTNLEAELNGLHKRRPLPLGFGAVAPDGRPLENTDALASLAYLPAEDMVSRGSLAGSITSPSEYSAPGRSTANTPGGTPSWDPATVGLVPDKRMSTSASSPGPMGGDSYFNTKPKTGGSSSGHRTRRNSRESDKRSSFRLSGGRSTLHESSLASPASPDAQSMAESTGHPVEDAAVSNAQFKRAGVTDALEPSLREETTAASTTASQPRTPLTSQRKHTQLHSYGADFSSTFQSLPPNSSIGKGVPPSQPQSRSGSLSQTDMTPPSDRLKSLILDSLPTHVFVALPQTGEIVWVNSRFLSYRGQNSGELAADPWGSIHPNDRDEYLKSWSNSVRTGEQFSRTVRIRRFDGAYRWFYARAVASKDKRGIIMQFLGSYMDIHDQHIAELRAARQEEIEASEAKHRLLANLIPQIIFTATEEDGITFSNEQWLSYTGQGDGDMLGLGFMDYVHPDDLAKCRIPRPLESPLTPQSRLGPRNKPPGSPVASRTQSGMPILSRQSSNSSSIYDLPSVNLTELAKKGIIKVDRDSSGRLSYTTEIRLRSKTGEYRWHLVRCVAIDNIDFGNGVSSYFGSATDINDLKLLETKLKEAMEAKGRFLSNMSHEIRTPLIGISGMVSFLQDTVLNEEQRDYTNTIQTSANSLLMIINDILDLSKVDAGMMKLNFEWFRIRALIEDVNELVSTMAIAKRLELNYVVEADVPTWIKGDKVRIRQILLNVIGNAIKFTSTGEVFSHCKVIVPHDLELDENEIMLEFSVIDTGRGFTKEEAELIFKPFSQIDGSSTRQHGGSGLGLVISRQLAELHGGRMDGVAVPGEGSTFTFSAKFVLPDATDRPEAAPEWQAVKKLPTVSEPVFNAQQLAHTRSLALRQQPVESPVAIDSAVVSPTLPSSGSSEPSVRSTRTHATERSSMSSVSAGLNRFSEAARASGQDLSQMKLEIPSGRSSPGTAQTPGYEPPPGGLGEARPAMYSIMVICPQKHSRWATTQHIEMTLPKEVPRQITAVASAKEAQQFFSSEDPVTFTHIVINLPEISQIIGLVREMVNSGMAARALILIATDSVLKQTLLKEVSGTKHEELLSEKNVVYISKPMKTSRLAVIFDPAKKREQSMDHNRSTAQRVVEEQKQSYLEAQRRLGNKGYQVLLVEDNLVNQKVLQKYLRKIGVEVDMAADGMECTEKVLSKPYGHYALILCDLHMPRKDGYQACREIRTWETSQKRGQMPIIALSANVMSDVQDKCLEAGFSDYITKPVDFVALSEVLSRFF